MEPARGNDSLPFVCADSVVTRQHFIETLAILIGRFVQLLANLLHHPQVFLALGFVIALRLLNSFFVRQPKLFASRFRLFEGLVDLSILGYQRGMVAPPKY